MPKTNEVVFKESRRVLSNLSQIFSFGRNTPNSSSKTDQMTMINIEPIKSSGVQSAKFNTPKPKSTFHLFAAETKIVTDPDLNKL